MNEDIKLGDLVRNTKGSYLKIKWLPTTMDRYENGEHIWYKRKFLAKVE
mgnify:CR=1 FL=1